MSNPEDKEKKSKRLHKEQAAIVKQTKIALQHGADRKDVEREPHRFAKHHAMDCGNPDCAMCASPRRVTGDRTKQEKSFDQTKTWVEE